MPWDSEIDRLRALTCAKWTWFEPDVIPAWVADMDFPPAPQSVAAIQALLERGDLGYNFAAANQIPQEYSDRQARLYGWHPDPAECRLFCDVMQAVETVLWLHSSPGDGVVLFTPVYHPFYKAIESCGCRLVDVPLEQGTWRLDADALEAAIDDGTRIILTCNPHNPSGRVFTAEELEAIADVAERHDLLIVSDEIWADIVFSGHRHVPIAALSEQTAARTVTISAASKAFNLAGLRCAVAHLGHRAIAEGIEKLPGHLLGAVGSPGAEATLAAWCHGAEWLAGTVTVLQSNRDHVAKRLAEGLPEARIALPEATYLAWIDLNAYGLGDDPAATLLDRSRIALSRGLDFGSRGAGFVRLNFATHRELLDEALDRLIDGCTAAG